MKIKKLKYILIAVISFGLCISIYLVSTGSPIRSIISKKTYLQNPKYSLDKIKFKSAVSSKSYDAFCDQRATLPVNNFSDLKGKTKVSDYVRDTDVWYTPVISDKKDFVYEAQALGYNAWNKSLLSISALERKICDTTNDFPLGVREYEWVSNDVLPIFKSKKNLINSKVDGLQVVLDYLKDKTNDKKHIWSAMESFTRYQHYAAEFGFDYIGCEIGASVPGSNVSVAFTRGAARQFNRSWFVDFSLWGAGTEGNGGSMINYSDDPTAFNGHKEAKLANNYLGGQGLSATRRHHFYAYMSGARWLINEAGANSAFYPNIGTNGYYKLTPHGLVFQEVYDFVQRNKDRGWNYTPYAIVCDYYTGLPFGLWNGNKVFESINPNDGDMMTQNILSMFYPGWNHNAELSKNQLINSPYGDSADVLLQNASPKVLNSYPVLILSGDIKFSEVEATRYRDYVKQGGILIMNTAYLESFPEFQKTGKNNKYEVTYGKGQVIVYGDDYNITELPNIVSKLSSKLIPFKIDGDVQYLVNVKEGSLVLTIINNNGVTKKTSGLEEYDLSAIQDVKISYTGCNNVLEVRDWMTGEKLSTNAEQIITLAPGDISVIEFVV